MKKLVSILLVLTMVLALAGTAMAACKIEEGWVIFTEDANVYFAPRASKKDNSVIQKGSIAFCDRVCGDYARVIVNRLNDDGYTKVWFKISTMEQLDYVGDEDITWVVWAKGGHRMSTSVDIERIGVLKGFYVKVSGHTNLRKDPGLEHKSQGVVEKCDLLKCTGYIGIDNRLQGYNWIQVCHEGKRLWVSCNFLNTTRKGRVKLYDADGNYLLYL